MTDINIVFCREVLRRINVDVRKAMPTVKLSAAWVYKLGRDQWEFHGPDKFYWHGRADNAYDARAKGWASWLRSKGAEGYAS